MTTDNEIRKRVKINRMSVLGVSEWAKEINALIAEGYVLAVATDSNDRLDIHNFTSHPRYVVMTKPGIPSEVTVVEEEVVEPEESISEEELIVEQEDSQETSEEEKEEVVEQESEKANKPGRKPKKA